MEMQPNTSKLTLTVAFVACSLLPIVSGCPGINPATNWPSQRLDNNPSTQPVALDVSDLDNDGRKDVVSLWRGFTVATSQPGVVAAHFQDDPEQWANVIIDADTRYAQANAITVADVNLDGNNDIIVAAHDRITYLRAPTDPRVASEWAVFDIVESIRTEFRAWFDVAAAQIDGINGLDIVASLNDDGRLVWFASPENPDSGSGWQIHSIDSTTRRGADSIVLIDMNGDGRLDVVSSASADNTGRISWYEQPADPTTVPWPKHIMTSFNGATRLAMGDLDNDGLPDLASVSPSTGRVAWFPRPEDVTGVWNGWVLADYTVLENDQREPVDLALADMDADGQLDVVVVNDAPASLFWYSPREDNRLTWSEHRIAALADVVFGLLRAEDTDGDGLPEVIVPVDQVDGNTLDRIERFINPSTMPSE